MKKITFLFYNGEEHVYKEKDQGKKEKVTVEEIVFSQNNDRVVIKFSDGTSKYFVNIPFIIEDIRDKKAK